MATSLAEQFPTLGFAEEADQWLLLTKNKTIVEQLKGRNIARVYIGALFHLDCLGELSRIGDNHYIGINANLSLEQKYVTLGHELAHTFEPDLAPFFDYPKPEVLERLREIEKFCEEFATQWIAINSEEKIRLFFENIKPVIVIIEQN